MSGFALREWRPELDPGFHVLVVSKDSDSIKLLLKRLTQNDRPVHNISLDKASEDDKASADDKKADEKKQEAGISHEGAGWLEAFIARQRSRVIAQKDEQRAWLAKSVRTDADLRFEDWKRRTDTLCQRYKEEKWSDADFKSHYDAEVLAEAAANEARVSHTGQLYKARMMKDRQAMTETVVLWWVDCEKRNQNQSLKCFFQNSRHFACQLISLSQDPSWLNANYRANVDIMFIDPAVIPEWIEDDLGVALTIEQWNECVRQAIERKCWIVRLRRPLSQNPQDHVALFPKH